MKFGKNLTLWAIINSVLVILVVLLEFNAKTAAVANQVGTAAGIYVIICLCWLMCAFLVDDD